LHRPPSLVPKVITANQRFPLRSRTSSDCVHGLAVCRAPVGVPLELPGLQQRSKSSRRAYPSPPTRLVQPGLCPRSGFLYPAAHPTAPPGRLQLVNTRSHWGSKAVAASYVGMSSSRKPNHYRARAEECCLKAILAEDVEQRTHWLEAAARWLSLGRQEDALPPRRYCK
jgi:hypothetical protein